MTRNKQSVRLVPLGIRARAHDIEVLVRQSVYFEGRGHVPNGPLLTVHIPSWWLLDEDICNAVNYAHARREEGLEDGAPEPVPDPTLW